MAEAAMPWPETLLADGIDIAWRQRCGNVTFGDAVRDRRDDEHLLCYLIDGGWRLEADGTEIALDGHDLLWWPPGRACELSGRDGAQSRQRRRGYAFRFLLRHGGATLGFDEPVLQRGCRRAERYVQDLEREASGQHVDRRRLAIHLYLSYTAGYLEDDEQPATGESPRFSDAQRHELLRYFQLNFRRPLGADELAAAMGLSRGYFARLFRRTFAMTPQDWMARERARRARWLLAKQDFTLAEIARRLGYVGVEQFTRQFKRIVGLTPARYRERERA